MDLTTFEPEDFKCLKQVDDTFGRQRRDTSQDEQESEVNQRRLGRGNRTPCSGQSAFSGPSDSDVPDSPATSERPGDDLHRVANTESYPRTPITYSEQCRLESVRGVSAESFDTAHPQASQHSPLLSGERHWDPYMGILNAGYDTLGPSSDVAFQTPVISLFAEFLAPWGVPESLKRARELNRG